jgi:deoxyhypusine synthase
MHEHEHDHVRTADQYGDGYSDGFEPVRPLDLSQLQTVDALLRAYRDASFGARRLGDAADVLETMARDPDCGVVCTLTGAMTVAKMGLVMCEMIDRGYVDVIISTGALMTHGLVEAGGHQHFKYKPGMDDKALYEKGYNRVYDTLELESNLDEVEVLVRGVLTDLPEGQPLGSHHLCRALGKALVERFPNGRGILLSAYKKNVPVIIPAFTDSEMGLDFAVNNERRRRAGKVPLQYDGFEDLEHYTAWGKRQKHLGIFTIGGGVPRNWAQQIGPYVEISAHRLGDPTAQAVRFQYGVRICPDPEHLGGLSGCTYSEGTSWGKFVPVEDGGRYAEVLTDATIAWPLIVKAVMDRVPAKQRKIP